LKKRFYNIVFIAFFVTGWSNAQNDIRKLTLSIVDTTDTSTKQVQSIYNWITSNIKYDIKALKDAEPRSQSPQQTISRGKGVCQEYSELLATMCNSVGIEAYSIAGYSKGYKYNKEKPFLKANHSWNVVFADSKWMHIDATWGSGYLATKPPTYQKILNSVAGIPFANSKLYFTSENSAKYFNIPTDLLTKTHYPLDPKWLFSETPMAFEAFQTDTIKKLADYPFFEQEIEEIRHKSSEVQQQIEGINGHKYNTLNYFDLANGYYVKSLNYDIERDITKNNSWQFNNYYNEYSIIIESIDKYKTLYDSVYRSRTSFLRNVSRDQRRLTGRIKSKANKAKKTHHSSQKQIVGKSSSYRKKINGFQINIGRAELKKLPLLTNTEAQYTDTLQVEIINEDINRLKAECTILNQQLDSVLGVIDNFSLIDAQYDDSIAHSNRIFKTNIDVLLQMVLSGNESIIIDYVDSLKLVYQDIEDFLNDKKKAKSDLQNTGRVFYAYSSLLQKDLKEKMSHNVKLQRLTNNADNVIIEYNQIVDELIDCYKKSIVFTMKLEKHNKLQTGIRQSNLTALKEQRKSINKENKFFTAWYENHNKQEKEDYTKEKELVKTIKSISFKNQKLVEMKLKKFKS
jgi:hypothetical protein